MSSLSDIQRKLRNLHSFAKQNYANKSGFQKKWKQMFENPIASRDTDYFLGQYREMYNKKGGKRTLKRRGVKRGASRKNYRKSRKQNSRLLKRRVGGYALTGAPLTYSMTPGTTANVYGRFPTEISTDPASIKNLDQFYGSALNRGCGIENSTRLIPANMGSNKVGGRRTRKGRSQLGGDLFQGLSMRGLPAPYYSTAPPNFMQTTGADWAGVKPFVSADPTQPAWNYSIPPPIHFNPNTIADISGTFSELAYSRTLPEADSI